MSKISIIVPVFNEENFIIETLKKINIQKNKFNLEIIVIDDGSNDRTQKLLNENSNLFDIKIFKKFNEGKGSAVKLGIEKANGEYTLIQDADLEYSPEDYEKIFLPIKNGADVVYGSRFKGSEAKRLIYFFHRIANFLITLLVNILTNINFSDVECGYKLVRTKLLKELNLKENSFAFEVELTMKLAKLPIKFYEVGINYDGRKYEEGKKIGMKDGFTAVYKIVYYFLFK